MGSQEGREFSSGIVSGNEKPLNKDIYPDETSADDANSTANGSAVSNGKVSNGEFDGTSEATSAVTDLQSSGHGAHSNGQQLEEPGEVVVDSGDKLQRGSWRAIFQAFAVLGWTAFGGPTAHIGRFHNDFVELRGWMSEGVFAELLALCQAMPGPASTQMSFAIGILQKGIPGGLLSGALFQYPGLIIMSLAGFGATKWLINPADWLSGASAGLAAVAVALVAEAALLLGTKLCKDRVTRTLCIAAAAITFYYQSQWVFPLLIVVGGLLTLIWARVGPKLFGASPSVVSASDAKGDVEKLGLKPLGGALLLLLWLGILVGSIIAKNATQYEDAKWIHWFESFYVTGSVTYGGGQVVLPILENSVVQYTRTCNANGTQCTSTPSPDTWVTEAQFLAGLALAQAMPGPLFNFSAYLGAIIGGVPGILACWLGLFGPGIMIIYGILPFWGRFRKWQVYREAMPGLNSTAIGLIYASVFTLGLKAFASSPFPTASVSIGILGYWANSFMKMPAPLVVLGGGVLGIIAWATDMH